MRTVKMSLIGLAVAGGMLVQTASVQAQRVKEEWVARYNGPGNHHDSARAMAIDDSGNVYVTGSGRSEQGGETYDYGTVKYDATGKQVWIARYNGPANQEDHAVGVVVDASGNVYVTGRSRAGQGRETDDYATIKYDPTGNQVWVARYNGPANQGDGATAIAVDKSGNVYVTGYSYGEENRSGWATVKYDPAGDELWVARHTRGSANAIAVDASGNVYVTGGRSSGGRNPSWDFATIKYDAEGKQLWEARWASPGRGHDEAENIVVDASGNVYVTGAAKSGNRDFKGKTNYTTVKYDPDGKELWVRRYDGPKKRSEPSDLAVDASGNVYVTGTSFGKRSAEDYATIKYDAAGKELWVVRYNSPQNRSDNARAIAVDGSGNVYVTGYSYNDSTARDYTTIKYNPAGKLLWLAKYDGPGRRSDVASAIAVDNSGNVYVTGGSYGDDTEYDYATIKYSQSSAKCTQDEQLQASCKDKKQGKLAKANALKGTPGDTVEFCLDNERCKVKTINHRGKARKKWKNVTPGEEHSVTADWDCGAKKERTIDCPMP